MGPPADGLPRGTLTWEGPGWRELRRERMSPGLAGRGKQVTTNNRMTISQPDN
jgi:hypothetical protein